MENNKYKTQIKHIRNNYKRFPIDLKIDMLEKLQEVCKKNNTTLTTEIKRFLKEYLEKNS